MPLREVFSNRDITAAFLEEAKQRLESWAQSYKTLRHLAELRGAFETVDKFQRSRKKRQS